MIAWLGRYKLAAEILAVLALLAGALIGFNRFCAYQQDIGSDRKQAEWTAQKAADRIAALELAAARQVVVDTAITQGAQRETTIKTLAAGSGAAVASLRDTIAAFQRGLPALAAEAAIERANTASALLGDCSARYRDVAEKADRHANDARTLNEAWPK